MIGIGGGDFIENGDGFAAIGVIVGVGVVDEKRKGVEGGGFGVIWIFFVEDGHGVRVVFVALVAGEFLVFGVVSGGGLNE